MKLKNSKNKLHAYSLYTETHTHTQLKYNPACTLKNERVDVVPTSATRGRYHHPVTCTCQGYERYGGILLKDLLPGHCLSVRSTVAKIKAKPGFVPAM